MATFFDDMPWLNIPEERKTVFIKPPQPPGGLLGGASAPKMSKLQALAAARKRKADEEAALVMLPKKEEQASRKEEPHIEVPQPDVLDRAKREDTSRKKSRNEPAQQQETRKTGTEEDVVPRRLVARPLTDGASDEQTTMAKPSAFAQVLCFGSASVTPTAPAPASPPHSVQVDIPPPWTAFTTPEALHEAFEQPSPDDVVLAAQSRSALTPLQQKSAPSRGESRK